MILIAKNLLSGVAMTILIYIFWTDNIMGKFIDKKHTKISDNRPEENRDESNFRRVKGGLLPRLAVARCAEDTALRRAARKCSLAPRVRYYYSHGVNRFPHPAASDNGDVAYVLNRSGLPACGI